MKLRCFPYDFGYTIKDGKVLMYLYSKLEDNQRICVVVEHQPFFYAAIAKVPFQEERFKEISVSLGNHQGKITSWEEVERELLGVKQKFLKIYTNVPKAVPPISKELESWGMVCYEKDVLFVQRYLRDTGILPLSLVEAEGEFVDDKEMRIPVFKANTIIPHHHESLEKLKILSFDIETYAPKKGVDPEHNPILMIAFSGADEDGQSFQKLLTWKKFPHSLDYVETVSDEEQLLQRFREVILSYKPDVITGYFSDGFDFPYLKTRADKWKVKLDLGHDHSEIEAGYQRKDAKIEGILHLDVFKFIRNIFGKNLKTDSFSLDEVAFELLGHRKHGVDVAKLFQAWDTDVEKLEEYCKYNMHDAYLNLQLCQKLLLEMIEFSKICGLPLFDVIRMSFSRLVESYIMKKAIEFSVISPNRPSDQDIGRRMEESYEGAFVYEPKPGVVEKIVVFDFRSLYPTIITSHNIGPEGLRCLCCQKEKNSQVPGFPNYWFCQREKKFIPQLLEELIQKRAVLKKAMKENKKNDAASSASNFLEAKSYALKILANSFYGYLGYFGARWYCFECARSTTAYARNYIQETIKKAQEKGFEVCYSDTDSCFILLGDHTLTYAKEFMNEINFSLPGQMELEYEGFFPRGIFVALKGKDPGKEKGAKKKYALLREDGSIKITGFEMVRRNCSEIAKNVQEQVIRLILEEKKKEAVNYAREVVKELKEGKIPLSRLIIKTKITRELDSYSSIGPHVSVGRRMKERGDIVVPGTIIEYVIAKGSDLVRDRAKLVEETKEGDYDADYYLHNQIIPSVAGIFAVVGYSEDDVFAESSQKGLGAFFK